MRCHECQSMAITRLPACAGLLGGLRFFLGGKSTERICQRKGADRQVQHYVVRASHSDPLRGQMAATTFLEDAAEVAKRPRLCSASPQQRSGDGTATAVPRPQHPLVQPARSADADQQAVQQHVANKAPPPTVPQAGFYPSRRQPLGDRNASAPSPTSTGPGRPHVDGPSTSGRQLEAASEGPPSHSATATGRRLLPKGAPPYGEFALQQQAFDFLDRQGPWAPHLRCVLEFWGGGGGHACNPPKPPCRDQPISPWYMRENVYIMCIAAVQLHAPSAISRRREVSTHATRRGVVQAMQGSGGIALHACVLASVAHVEGGSPSPT